MATGGSKLIDYNFKFIRPKSKDNFSEINLNFNVRPKSFPPTNIHVLIGRNGVGKTHLINNMISSLVEKDVNYKKNGKFINDSDNLNENPFANLITISFSAFDENKPQKEITDKTKGVQFTYIGLKRTQERGEKNLSPKSTLMLRNEFKKSLIACRNSSKIDRWKKSIKMLESDPNFEELNISDLIESEDGTTLESTASQVFKRLSSGHKIVLLTITRLIETLQEKSLVLIDEPEAHLHPPLLSAFTRTLSELLTTSNGVAIIATHSPVVLQEVPKSCVWKLRKTGSELKVDRLKTESFGENVGILTNEVFGLEVTHSGYYKLLNQAIKENDTYELIIEKFNNQLGMEAKAVLMSIMTNKK